WNQGLKRDDRIADGLDTRPVESCRVDIPVDARGLLGPGIQIGVRRVWGNPERDALAGGLLIHCIRTGEVGGDSREGRAGGRMERAGKRRNGERESRKQANEREDPPTHRSLLLSYQNDTTLRNEVGHGNAWHLPWRTCTAVQDVRR